MQPGMARLANLLREEVCETDTAMGHRSAKSPRDGKFGPIPLWAVRRAHRAQSMLGL